MTTERVNKYLTISTLLSIMVLLSTQVYTYGQNQLKLDTVQLASTTHILKSELNQILETQDYKMQHVVDDIKEVKQALKENQKMMIELLQRIPKKDN